MNLNLSIPDFSSLYAEHGLLFVAFLVILVLSTLFSIRALAYSENKKFPMVILIISAGVFFYMDKLFK